MEQLESPGPYGEDPFRSIENHKWILCQWMPGCSGCGPQRNLQISCWECEWPLRKGWIYLPHYIVLGCMCIPWCQDLKFQSTVFGGKSDVTNKSKAIYWCDKVFSALFVGRDVAFSTKKVRWISYTAKNKWVEWRDHWLAHVWSKVLNLVWGLWYSWVGVNQIAFFCINCVFHGESLSLNMYPSQCCLGSLRVNQPCILGFWRIMYFLRPSRINGTQLDSLVHVWMRKTVQKIQFWHARRWLIKLSSPSFWGCAPP